MRVGTNALVGTPINSSKSLLETGFGGILGHIAPIIGLGTVLGAIMERSGGADVLATRLLRLFGPKGAPLAMGLTGLIFGVPVFVDIGIFVLAPLVYVAAKRGGRSLVLYALPMLAGLSMTHASATGSTSTSRQTFWPPRRRRTPRAAPTETPMLRPPAVGAAVPALRRSPAPRPRRSV